MADMIARLKVDSSEYDSKIKRASEGILKLERTIRDAGESFLATWKDEQNFVKGLGQMETISRTARGKISELTASFTDLSMVYKRMTDEEKNSPFGQALRSSLDQLKVRIQDSQKDLADVNKELGKTTSEGNSTSKILDQLAGKFGISTKALTTWGFALGAGAAALKVAKDTFFASEQNLDDWNRMVYSSQSTYEAFLTSLNTGDVSGFLNNINTIVKAANDAYDAIDRLQTTQNIQKPQVAKRQAELQRMETMLRTGRYIAPIDGRTATPGLKDGDKLTKAQKDRLANQVENIIRELAGLTKNEVKAANQAIDKLFNEQALRLGMTKQQFLSGTATIDTFEQNVALGKKYQDWERNRQAAIDLAKAGHYNVMTAEQKNFINTANPYQQYKGWSVFKDDGELYQSIITNIQNRSAQEQQYYSELARAYRQINRAEGYTPYGGSGGSKTGREVSSLNAPDFRPLDALRMTESKAELEARLKSYQQELSTATNMFVAGSAQKGIEETQRLLDAQPLALKMGIGAEAAAQLIEQKNSLQEIVQKSIDEEALRISVDLDVNSIQTTSNKIKSLGEELAKSWNNAADAVSSIGSALRSIDDPGAQVAGLIANAIATIAQTFAKSLSGSVSVWDWIAGAAAGTATMISTIAAIKSSTYDKYAEGGIVPGNSFSGDMVPAMVNSGELILNKSQQNNIAQLLTSDNNNTSEGGSVIIGSEDIRIIMRNGARRRGMSVIEYLTI